MGDTEAAYDVAKPHAPTYQRHSTFVGFYESTSGEQRGAVVGFGSAVEGREQGVVGPSATLLDVPSDDLDSTGDGET